MQKKALIGYFDATGYHIDLLVDGDTQDTLCTCGNNRFESTETIDPDDPAAFPVDEIKKYCESTGLELSGELDIEFLGAEYNGEKDSRT